MQREPAAPASRRCALTGERTLPDVPEENYWFRRHLAVYEWIAARVARAAGRRPRLRRGLRLRRPRPRPPPRSSASTPTRRPTSTPGCATGARTCASSAAWSRRSRARATRSSSCRRSSTSTSPATCSTGFAEAAPVAYVSTPNRLTLAPRGRGEVRQPLAPARVHGRRVPGAARAALLAGRALRPLPRPQAARPRARAAGRLGSRPPGAAGHEALLRPLRAGDRGLGLRAPARGGGDLDRALDFVAVCHA